MSSEQDDPPPRQWILPKYVMGNMPFMNELLDKRHVMLQSLVWYLRAISMPLYVNNPISGIFVFTAVYINNYVRGTNGTLALASSFYVFYLGLKSLRPLRDGDLVLNCYLLGVVVPMFVAGEPMEYNWRVILIVMLLSVLCAYLAVGVHSITSRANLPALNLAYSIIVVAFVGSMNGSVHFPAATTTTSVVQTYSNISGTLIGEGIIKGIGQTMGITNFYSCGLLLVAMLIYSPIFLFQAVLGSCLGVCTALAVGAPLANITNGMYSYNAVWSCVTVGGLYIVFGAHGELVTILAGITSTLIYIGMERPMMQIGLTPLSFPHVITVYLILAAAQILKGLPTPFELTYPEQHFYEWLKSEAENSVEPDANEDKTSIKEGEQAEAEDDGATMKTAV